MRGGSTFDSCNKSLRVKRRPPLILQCQEDEVAANIILQLSGPIAFAYHPKRNLQRSDKISDIGCYVYIPRTRNLAIGTGPEL